MSFNSIHMAQVVDAKLSRAGTEYSSLDEAFGMTSMALFQPHNDLMGQSLFDDCQIMVSYVKNDGIVVWAATMVGYAWPHGVGSQNFKKRLVKLNGETAYRIIRAINRAKALKRGLPADEWRTSATFNPSPTLNAYMEEQLATATGPVQYANRMGGPNAAKQVFKAALRISKRNLAKSNAAYRRYIVTTSLEISDDKYEELLILYNLQELDI